MDSERRLHRISAFAWLWVAIALVGVVVGWNCGQLPRREVPAEASATAPDLALYGQVIREVRAGGDYYEVARETIPQFGFPISSPLNWRLPTYAWLLSRLPNKCWIQAALLLLGILALGLSYTAERRRSSLGGAVLTTLGMFGVVRWVFDGEAYLAQEVWAGILIAVSVACHALGSNSNWWRLAAVAAGVLALLFRELALPYCLVAGALAAWNRRWLEAALWALGIAAFVGLFAWHVLQVHAQLSHAQLPATEHAAGAGLAQWLRFGGLDFVLLTLRMNGLLFAAPAAVLWLYLIGTLGGLARQTDDTSRLACLSGLLFILAFAVVGRPENFYWGLVCAPLLPWGLAPAWQAMRPWLAPSGDASAFRSRAA
jgi:hypothetical protein